MPGLMERLLPRRKHSINVSREIAEQASDHLVEMDARLEELAELPGLEEFAKTHKLPARFLELWDAALAAYDRYLGVMTSAGALEVRCGTGCSACCHEVPTGVQAVELVAIYQRYRELPDFAELHNRACDLADQFTALLAERAPDQTSIASDSPAAAAALFDYRRKRLPCVFLGADQRCRIYDRRPIPCRMHFSLSNPEWCVSDHPKADQAITPNLEPPKDMLDHMRTIARRMGLEGMPPTLFQGLGLFGGQVMKTERLQISKLESSSKRHPRG